MLKAGEFKRTLRQLLCFSLTDSSTYPSRLGIATKLISWKECRKFLNCHPLTCTQLPNGCLCKLHWGTPIEQLRKLLRVSIAWANANPRTAKFQQSLLLTYLGCIVAHTQNGRSLCLSNTSMNRTGTPLTSRHTVDLVLALLSLL